MTRRYYSSSAADTTLSSSITAGATSITVASVTGFPVQYPYTLILDPETASEEIVSVTAGTGTTLTVTRGEDSTTALAHTTGATVRHGVSARDYDEPNAHIQASSAVHGLTGTVVGTTDTQVLTNKDLTDATNTFPNTVAWPTGSVIPYAGATAPNSEWLITDGSAVSRSTYADLFALVGTTYGAGNGTTTFNIPDTRGRHILGAGTGSGLTARTLAATGGSEDAIVVTHSHSHSHSASSGTVSSDHTHGFTTGGQSNDHTHALGISDAGGLGGGGSLVRKGGVAGDSSGGISAGHTHSGTTGGISSNHTHSVTVNSDATASGSSGAGANMAPYLVLNHIIKV